MAFGEEEERRRKVAFLSQIRLGDILVAGSMAVAVIVGWTKMDARLARVDEIIAEVRLEQNRQRADVKESVGDLRLEIRDVRNSVDGFARKLERRGP